MTGIFFVFSYNCNWFQFLFAGERPERRRDEREVLPHQADQEDGKHGENKKDSNDGYDNHDDNNTDM